MTLPSDTYFKNGVNILVFIEHMQRNFILTDVMKSGYHLDLENFINHNSFKDQTFDMTGEYFSLHNYDLDRYDRKFAIIDCRVANAGLAFNKEYNDTLRHRVDLLHSQGFTFIKATPWESEENIANTDIYPKIDIEHIKWTAGTSWFWFYMYNKHKANKFNFTHDHDGSYWHKKYDFLYLNKQPRPHRVKLYDRLYRNKVLDNSIHTFINGPSKRRLPKEYELPGIEPKDYPRFGKDQDITEPPYVDTVCSIVSETNDNNNDIFMTEKIWKPIMAQHVFIVHGNYLYLQKLREMGFKTFSQHIDESYDLERDADKRLDKIADLLIGLKKNLCDNNVSVVNAGNKKWHDIYLQTKALRQHNYDLMFNQEALSKEINKTINLFLEFADSRKISS